MPPPESNFSTSASLLLRVRDAADGEA